MMVDIKTAEQLIYFMRTKIRLSRYDSKFLENLEQIHSTKNQVTTNQVKLLHKIVGKYHKQFVQHQMFIEHLIRLPWVSKVIESSPEYTNARISIEEGSIVFRAPYNKTFVQAFGKSSLKPTPHNFKWDNDRKYYHTPFGSSGLKLIVTLANAHFESVVFCPIVTKIVDSMNQYASVTHWSPTLMRVNGNLLIAASNQYLNDATAHIALNTELATLATLAGYGIEIDDSITEGYSEREKFITQYNPTVELHDVTDIIPWLSELACDAVLLSGGAPMTTMRIRLKNALNDHGIKSYDLSDMKKLPDMTEFKFPVAIRFRLVVDLAYEPIKLAKIIQLVNSQPIDLGNR